MDCVVQDAFITVIRLEFISHHGQLSYDRLGSGLYYFEVFYSLRIIGLTDISTLGKAWSVLFWLVNFSQCRNNSRYENQRKIVLTAK